MCSVQLRIPLGLGHRLIGAIAQTDGRERVAFCLVSLVDEGGGAMLLARDMLTLPDGAYKQDSLHGAEWRGAAMIPVINAAVDRGLGVVLVHAHPWGSRPGLSEDDLDSARRLLPMLQGRVPGRPHGSIVFGGERAAGILLLPGSAACEVDIGVRWMGSSLVDWPAGPLSTNEAFDPDVFDRQALVVGDQSRLRHARMGVVGLGGGGSHVVQQLAHTGVGSVIGVDADTCEPTNLHRLVGMQGTDAEAGLHKVEILDRLVRNLGTGTTFVGVDASFPDPRAVAALARADVLISCVDSLQTRADIQEFAWRRLIPCIDMGVSIRALRAGKTEARAAVGGNLLVLIPGGFCMWCCGFLSEEKLEAERGGKPRTYFESTKGEAQVVSFNGLLASQAVTEVLQLLTGFRGSTVDPGPLMLDSGLQRGAFKLDGMRGTLDDWGAAVRTGCACCENLLGAGTVAWRRAAPATR